MANNYDAKFRCTSNVKFFQHIDNLNFIKKSNSKLLSIMCGILFFQCESGGIFFDFAELSKKYPDEDFLAEISCVDYYGSEIKEIIFRKGKPQVFKTARNFTYESSHIEEMMGKENFRKLMFEAMKYITLISKDIYYPKNQIFEAQKVSDDEYLQQSKEKIDSFATITVQNEKFKIEATLVTFSFIKVYGYVKDITNTFWVQIEDINDENEIAKINKRDSRFNFI